MNSSQLIEKLNRFYDKLESNKKYSFLIKGKWGIGKTHTYDRFIEKKNLENKSYKYSLFGMKDLRELEKELLKDRFFPTIKKLQDGAPKKVISNILSGVLKSLPIGKEIVESIDPSKLIELLSIKDLDYDENSLVCLDDFERSDIPMKELMGFVERLKSKVNLVILCNEEEMEENKAEEYKVYKNYKEKVIDFTYSLEDIEDKIILVKLSEFKLSEEMGQLVLKEFKKYCKDNLRVLEKFIHLYRELTLDLKNYNLNKKSEKKVVQACFYLSCEENLNLIEEYIKEKKLSKDWQDNYEEVVWNNIYSNVYKFEYQELIEEIKKYLLGSKECIDNIILNLKVEVEESIRLVEGRINSYFLADIDGVKKLFDEISNFVKKSNKEHYTSSTITLKLYSYYLLFSEITKNKLDDDILKELESYLYSLYKEKNYLKDPYKFLEEDSFLKRQLYFNFNGRLEENVKVKLEELRKNFDERRKGEILVATESLLKEKRYSEVYEEVKYWSHIPEFLLEYLKSSFDRKISLEEWDLWAGVVENTRGEEREKVKEIINEMDRSDKVTKLRIEYFVKKMD